MRHLDEYAADRRAALSRAGLPAQWRSWMDQWSLFRGQAWKIDLRWSASQLKVYSERLKGDGEWAPLSNTAPAEIILIDQCVADLVGCVIAHEGWDCDVWTPEKWARLRQQLWHGDWEDDELDHFSDQLDEDQRWRDKFKAAREREGDLLLMHYLLPHVRQYGKLRALQLGERAYFYRLNSALQTLDDEYSFRANHLNNVQS